MIDVYVDGSEQSGRVGYGWIVLRDGVEWQRGSGVVKPEDVGTSRQVAGELMATGHALRWCKNQQVPAIRLFYDYKGIECWATGTWKAKQPLTQRYTAFMKEQPVRVQFMKVKSHSGNFWNEQVDELARKAAESAPINNAPVARLDRVALPIVAAFRESGYEVQFVGIFNHMFARFEFSDQSKRLALFDLYDTKLKVLEPYIHACRNPAEKRRLETLWGKMRDKYLGG